MSAERFVRVPGEDLLGVGLLDHRSTSPMIGSMLEMMAIAVGHEAALDHRRQRLQVVERGAPDVHPVRPARPVRHQVAAQLAPGVLDRHVCLPRRDLEALGEDLEVVDQRFHRLVDAGSGRRGDLAVLDAVVAVGHLLHALPHDLQRLGDLVEANAVAVERVAVLGVDDVEVDLVVGQVWLRLAQVPRHPGRAEDRPAGAEGEGLFGRDDADPHRPLHPDRVLGQQLVVLGHALWHASQISSTSRCQPGGRSTATPPGRM